MLNYFAKYCDVPDLLLLFLVVLFTICILYYNYQRIDLYICSWKIPGPLALPIIGCGYKFLLLQPKDVQPMIQNIIAVYGNLCRFWIGPELNIVICEPKHLEKILTSHNTLLKGKTYKYIQAYLGPGLLSDAGYIWKKQRKSIAPAFHRRILINHLESFNIFSREIVDNFKPLADGRVVNIFHTIADSVNKTVCETLLGVEPTEELKNNSYFIHHIEELYKIIFLRMTKYWYQFDFVFNKSKYLKIQQEVQRLIEKFAKYVHNEKFGTGNFVKNENIALDYIVDQRTDFHSFQTTALTLQTASEESIATIVSFILMMLGIDKDIQKKISNELQEVFGDSERFFEYEDLSKLQYLDLIVKEALRMFPIGSLITRTVENSFHLTDDLLLPKGCTLTIPIYGIHRNPKLWDDPNKFIPERFLPENSVNRHPYSYLPFSHGPMNCIGQTYAIWCIKVVASTIIRYYKIDSDIKSIDDLEVMTDISIRPINGYKVKLYPKIV